MYVSIMYVRKSKSINLKNFFDRQRIADMEKKATLIMCNPKLIKISIFLIGSLLFCCTYNPIIAVSNPFDKIGNTFWIYVKSFGRWACLLLAGIEVIKSLNAGDTKSIAKILFKYIIAYMTFTVLPWFFDEIDRSFKM